MRKSTIVKVLVGSVAGFVVALVLFLVAGALALKNDPFVWDGSDVAGIRPDSFIWSMIGLAGLAVVGMIVAGVGLLVAWIGALLNAANLANETWLVILLGGGLLGLGFIVTLVYVIAGSDRQPTNAVPSDDVQAPEPMQSPASRLPRRAVRESD